MKVKNEVKGFFQKDSENYDNNLRSGTMLNLSPSSSNITINDFSSINSVPSKMSKSKSTPVFNQDNT